MKVTEDAAFQRPLEGWVARMGKSLQGSPVVVSSSCPSFYWSKHHPLCLQGTPAGVFMGEFQDVMKYGTPDERAILGRAAAGKCRRSGVWPLPKIALLVATSGPDRDLWLKNMGLIPSISGMMRMENLCGLSTGLSQACQWFGRYLRCEFDAFKLL